MSKLFFCSSIFGRFVSCKHQRSPTRLPRGFQQQQETSQPPGREGSNSRAEPSSGQGAAAASAGQSLGSWWRLGVTCGAAATLVVPFSDIWSEISRQRRVQQEHQCHAVAMPLLWRLLGGLGVYGVCSTAQCMLEVGSHVGRKRQLGPAGLQLNQNEKPLEEVAKSLTAKSFEQVCRLCTSRAVAEARAGRPDRARDLWQAAADFSYPPALFNLGLLAASSGLDAEAAGYYRAAADLGHPAAAYNLSLMLMEQEEAAAVEACVADGESLKGAELELPLSLTVSQQQQQQQPPRESHRWLALAVNSGLPEAMLLDAERLLVDERRPEAAERRLMELLASGEASESTAAVAEGLLSRCHRLSSRPLNPGSTGAATEVATAGLRRCSRSAPDFACLTLAAAAAACHLADPLDSAGTPFYRGSCQLLGQQ